MAQYKPKQQTPTRELRTQTATAEVRLPATHRIAIGIIVEICCYEGNGCYIGKIHSSLGSQPITVYDSDENLKDFISKADEPRAWLIRFCEEMWGAVIAREAAQLWETRVAGKLQEAPKGS